MNAQQQALWTSSRQGRRRYRTWRCLAVLAGLWTGIGAAQDATPGGDGETEISFALQQLGGGPAEEIRGVDGLYSWPLGVRLDQTVTAATLELRYVASPALLPELSHLKLRINGETVATIPLPRETQGAEQRREIAIDPGYFSDYNQLTLQLIGHYSTGCEDPYHTALWASVSGKSRLKLRVRPLALAPDLAHLPVPFFDVRDGRRLVLPFVFGQQRPLEMLEAAGTVASWFGALADYRGAEFPVAIDRPPDGLHAIVFATNADAPAGLSLPPVSKPTLRVMAHPDGSAARLLVLQGRDTAQLRIAAQALASGQTAFSGAEATLDTFEPLPARRPYDAPRWVSTDGPVRLGSLVSDPAALQAYGHAPPPIKVSLNLPPDLFFWNRKGLPLHLLYRYTAPTEEDNSLLGVSMNEQLVRSFRLRPVDGVEALLDGTEARLGRDLVIPPFQLQPVNELQFRFSIDYHRPGPCRDSGVDLVRAAIDPDSTIDLSGVPHYAELPDLERFANAGFPFTRLADLAETALVLPEMETPADIEAALALMGHMGRVTGVAATRAVWVRAEQIDQVAERDLLIVGGGMGGTLLKHWNRSLPLVVDGMRHELSALSRLLGYADTLWRSGPQRGAAHDAAAWRLAAQSQGPLAAWVGFESPLHRGRSAVALLATSRDDQRIAWSALLEPAAVARMHGDVVVLRDDQIESYDSGARYTVGRLPPWSGLWWRLSRHPLLLVAAALGAALLGAIWVRWLLRRASRRRLASS